MPKFRVTCSEEVTTEFFVEAPNRERLDDWLEEEGADVVSYKTERQTVHEREYEVEACDDGDKHEPDANTEEEFVP